MMRAATFWPLEAWRFVSLAHNFHFLPCSSSSPCRPPHPTDWSLATQLAKMVQKQRSHWPHLSTGFLEVLGIPISPYVFCPYSETIKSHVVANSSVWFWNEKTHGQGQDESSRKLPMFRNSRTFRVENWSSQFSQAEEKKKKVLRQRLGIDPTHPLLSLLIRLMWP